MNDTRANKKISSPSFFFEILCSAFPYCRYCIRRLMRYTNKYIFCPLVRCCFCWRFDRLQIYIRRRFFLLKLFAAAIWTRNAAVRVCIVDLFTAFLFRCHEFGAVVHYVLLGLSVSVCAVMFMLVATHSFWSNSLYLLCSSLLASFRFLLFIRLQFLHYFSLLIYSIST